MRSRGCGAEDIAILGIFYDSTEGSRVWVEDLGSEFFLLSGTERRVGAVYGVRRPPEDRYAAHPERVTFAIDPEGTLRLVCAVAGSQIDIHASQVLEDLPAVRPANR